jgi:hypothetical protein
MEATASFLVREPTRLAKRTAYGSVCLAAPTPERGLFDSREGALSSGLTSIGWTRIGRVITLPGRYAGKAGANAKDGRNEPKLSLKGH